ncbi:alpha/beta hydrolase [Paenibacillus hodogayensis]|uniref:Alpha/beta hydrolase n=1 Tax=Paenibacillus hodogayensis TaxID=279208 RepID=A0ABV5VZ06_9BACL
MDGTIHVHRVRDRAVSIYVPPDYDAGSDTYPVAYVQDGDELFAPGKGDSLTVLEAMFGSGELEPLLLVGVEPKERLNEYTPWPARALVEEFADFGGQGAGYIDFLEDELKPFVDKHYRTKPCRADTGIIGASLGGLVSMYAAYTRPDLFGGIGSLSGSYWYEGFVGYMRHNPLGRQDLRIYMYVGGAEGANKTTLQKDMIARTKEAHGLLLEQGLGRRLAPLTIEDGAGHEWSCFIKRFPEALRWMFAHKDDVEENSRP